MITSRATLITAIARWTRNSSLSTDDYDDFIAFTHAKLNRLLRTREMLSDEITGNSLASGLFLLPSTCLEVDYVRGSRSGDKPLPNVSSTGGYSLSPQSATGSRHVAYTIAGAQIQFYPAIAAEFKYRYYQQITPLVASGDTNWLLLRHPDVYLYGAIMHMKGYVDDDRVVLAADEFNRVISEIKEETKRQEMASANLEIQSSQRYP